MTIGPAKPLSSHVPMSESPRSVPDALSAALGVKCSETASPLRSTAVAVGRGSQHDIGRLNSESKATSMRDGMRSRLVVESARCNVPRAERNDPGCHGYVGP